MIERNDPCFCGSGKKWKKCHYPHKPVKNLEQLSNEYLKNWGIRLKDEVAIDKIRKACQLASDILDALAKKVKPGVTTEELDEYAAKLHKEANAIPAPYGYGDPPYPKSICTSINDVICHGIPDDTPLRNGDIINIDISPILDGYFGDSSRMYIVGVTDDEKKNVVETAYESMMKGIKICAPGVPLNAIGKAIEDHARSRGCTVVNEFVGHGIGYKFHEPPQIFHNYNEITTPMAPGMIFTVEPMINAGVRGAVFDENKWTARTRDGKPSAQWEHTILITDNGHEILTKK